jgi:hypothetical protein
MQNELPVTASGTLALLYNTKSQNDLMAERIIQEIEEGNVSALKVHLSVKSIENLLKQLTDKKTNPKLSAKYKQLVGDEADKYPEKTFKIQGATFTKKGGGTTYDYSVCNDPILAKLEREIDECQRLIDERKEILKTLPKSGLETLIDDELITLYPPNKYQSETLSVTLPK